MKAPRANTDTWAYTNYFYAMVGVASIVYLLAVFFSNYEAGQSNLRLILNLSIAFPSVAIWLLATRGVVRFKQYSEVIRLSKDGAGLNDIANALLWMTAYIIALILAAPLESLLKDTSYVGAAVAVGNHLPLLLALISSTMFYRGALRLNTIVPLRVAPTHSHLFTALGVIAACLFTLYFYVTIPTIGSDNGLPRFAGPVLLLIFTYALPHLLVWGLGAYASISLFNYSLRVKGEIYKRSFRTLYKGVLLVFLCTFIAQLLMASNISLARFSALLAVTYGLLLLGIYGFVLIYQGAANLHRIENI